MRRGTSSSFKRFSCRIGVGTSLLLAVLLAGLWVRSYWKADLLTDWFFRPSGDHFLEIWPLVRSERGGISFRVKTSHVAGPPRPYPSDRRQVDPARAYPVFEPLPADYPPSHLTLSRNDRWQFAGFQVAHVEQRVGGPSALPDTDTNVTIPHAAWVMLFLIAPALGLRRLQRERMRARRIRAALCAACGYDLRGGQSRCPECGTDAPAAGDHAAGTEHDDT